MIYVISLGSNTPDRKERMSATIELLRHDTSIIIRSTSDFYETPALGGGTRPYLNAVAEIDSEMPTEDLQARFKQMERESGRNEEARKRGDVPIDIDIVECDGEVVRPKDYNAEYYRIGKSRLTSYSLQPE